MDNNFEISEYGNNLIYKNEYSRSLVYSIIEENSLNGVKINTRWLGCENLNFLSEYDFLESLDIVSDKDLDFSFLKNLKNLKTLSIAVIGYSSVIDLSQQINLTNLTLYWRKDNILGLDNCKKIISLCLVEYAEDNMQKIANLHNVENLKIKTSTLTNCSGIENLNKLKSLYVGNSKKLCSIDAIKNLKNINTLKFDTCPKIRDFSIIENLTNLTLLEIIDSKEIISVDFVKKLAKLKRLILLGNTYVIDGNLSVTQNISEVFYKMRSHYDTK